MKIKRTLVRNQKILWKMAQRGISPDYAKIPNATSKAWKCPTCGSRHARLSDVLNHWYNEHFLKPQQKDAA